MIGRRPFHVVLVTYGEPPDPVFTDQLAYSWRILVGLTRTVAPIPKPLLPVIAVARARGRARLWRAEGYRSPLEPTSLRQAALVQAALTDEVPEVEWRTHVAYEFRHPLVDDVVRGLPADEPACLAPMYVADSAFTHELSRTIVREPHHRRRQAPVTVLDALDAHALAQASARHVLDTAAEARAWRGPDVALVLAAHGTVLQPPRPIETGLDATERVRQQLAAQLAPHFGLVAHGWLNHTRGGAWTSPPIQETLRAVKAKGFSRIAYFPFGFLADNAESQLEGRMAVAEHGGLDAHFIPCLNDSPHLTRLLTTQVLEHSRTLVPA